MAKPPPPSGSRPKSALEALEEARQAEAASKQAEADARKKRALAQALADEARRKMEDDRARRQVEDQRRRAEVARREALRREEEAREEQRRAQEEDREAEDQAARDRAIFKSPASTSQRAAPATNPLAQGKVIAILRRVADDVELIDVYADIRGDVLAMLWQHHVKRARYEQDLPTLAAALTLVNRFEHRPDGLLAARVQWADKEFALWLDTERKEVIAALTPADRYLTGL